MPRKDKANGALSLSSSVAGHIANWQRPGQGEYVDLPGPGPFQHFCRFVDRRPGGHHIIDQQDIHSRDPVGPVDRKRALDIFRPFDLGFSGLRIGVSHPAQQTIGQRQAQRPRNFPGNQEGLVKRPFLLPS